MPKILLVGGSRDGEWIDAPDKLEYLRVPIPMKAIRQWKAEDYEDIYQSAYRTETYKRIRFSFREGQELDVYAIEGSEGYQVFDLLLRNYNPKPPADEPPKPQPEDPDVARRKAEDKLAAAAWNAFMSTPIPKQK